MTAAQGAYDSGGFVPDADTPSGQVDREGVLDYTIGIGMKRPVVYQRDEVARRYPDSLMPFRRVRVKDFSINLGYERTSEPEAVAAGRRLFEEVLHAVEQVIADFDLRVVSDPQLSHGSPSIGAEDVPASAVSDLIVGDASDAGVAPSAPASGAPSAGEVRS